MAELQPVPPTPTNWSYSSRSELISAGVMEARPDVIIPQETAVPTEILVDLLFEDIGGEEILSFARNDLVNGNTLAPQLISNINRIAQKMSSLNILPSKGTIVDTFSEYPLQLQKYLPASLDEAVYIDEDFNVVIEFQNSLPETYDIEVELISFEDSFNGTIY